MEYPKPEILDKESLDSRNGIQVHDRTQTGKRKESKHSLHWTGRTIRFSVNKVTLCKQILLFLSQAGASGPIGRSMTRILQLQRSICITPEQWTGEGVIYGVWKRGRSRIDCYLKKWSGMDLITHWRLHWRFWLALLCVFCVSLFMYSCLFLFVWYWYCNRSIPWSCQSNC
jgi:hypothetical protein